MEREEALRQLRASSAFTFVGDKVLLRQANVLKAVQELQKQADLSAQAQAALAQREAAAPTASNKLAIQAFHGPVQAA